jgi:hypothetical protein
MPILLTDQRLEQSTVVANSTMNRQRACVGCNSYEKELNLDPVKFLQDGLPSSELNYLGADDEAGPNYTGQPVMNSDYDC